MKERDLVKKIRTHLETKYGAVVVKHWGGSFAQAGVADLLICLSGGRYCAVEVKTKTGTTSALQDDFLRRVRVAGGIAFVARSIEDVDNLLGWLLLEKKEAVDKF